MLAKMAIKNSLLPEVKNSVTSIFTKAASSFFLNPSNKPEVLTTTEWTDLFNYVSEKFFSGAEQGFGIKLAPDIDAADKEVLENLRLNLYRFSAMKNYQLLQTLNGLLVDEKREVRSKSEFLKLALDANEEYNSKWLETEYNMAVGKATGQARMKQFIAEAKDYDLMWQTVGDDRVRDSHAANDGLVVAADSATAKSLIFPIDWGCRCEWIQIPINSRKRSTDSSMVLPTPVDGLSVRTGEVFTDQHQYYSGVSPTDKTALENFADDQIKKLSEGNQ
jgi:SPP1 gp7 family putative phage head morphogenesis protein